ncbi:MAG: exodeoxyribonuclease VII large subunit, partial [Pseudomonadota bacterium]
KLSAFGAQSKYNMNVDEVAVAGQGALMAMLEKRKVALEAEGLFDPARKKPLPYLPEIIGVVTSPSGAVIRDILHRLRERFPRKVLVWPVAVQGAACAPEVARAIEGFNALTPGGALPRPDLLIVARGGGSIEDLWGFNEEVVARAASTSEIPLISAVGHETDTTLIDFVSDRRAPTPTAAAEMAVPVRADLLAWVAEQGARLARARASGLSQRAQRLTDLSRALPRPEALTFAPRQRFDLMDKRLPGALIAAVQIGRVRLAERGGLRASLLARGLASDRQRLDALAKRLPVALERAASAQRERLGARIDRLSPAPLMTQTQRARRDVDRLATRLRDVGPRAHAKAADRLAALDRLRETLGYRATLARGYAVVRADGQVATRAEAVRAASSIEIEFADGRATLGNKPARKSNPKTSGGESPDQGTLL